MNELVIAKSASSATIQPVIDLVCNSVDSPHTRRAYERALGDFMAWYVGERRGTLNKATVQIYLIVLRKAGTSESSINQRLTAIRKLATELADNEIISESAAHAIQRVKGIRQEGKRLGNWLTREQAQALLDAPNVKTIKGLRDRAILAVLLGAGLRREECVSLTVGHLQQRDGRWAIVDLVGKRNKMRSVPVDSWIKHAIDTYLDGAGIATGALFRAARKGGKLEDRGMTPQAILDMVQGYAGPLGLTVRPHDLRRTFAKLAQKGGAEIQQIQFSLGHSSVQTTERYLGTHQDFTTAPSDLLGLRINT